MHNDTMTDGNAFADQHGLTWIGMNDAQSLFQAGTYRTVDSGAMPRLSLSETLWSMERLDKKP